MPTVHALRVVQPIGEFFVTVIPAKDVVHRVRNRPRSSAAPDSDDIQRSFNKKRIGEITQYTEDPDATFPTPIILSVESSRISAANGEGVPENGQVAAANGHAVSNGEEEDDEKRLFAFHIPDDDKVIGDVLDGQHRVLGLLHSRFRESGDFDLVVVLMFDLDPDDEAYVFSIINSKQTPVSASLIYDLFDLSEHRSPQKTCHFVAQALNRQEGGPFYQRLKMLGRKEPHHTGRVMLSQGTFAARLERLITKNAARDARLEKLKQPLPEEADCPLRKYYIRKEDQTILKIVQNFFEAAKNAFRDQWESDTGEFVIRKTAGYTALIKVLANILPAAIESKNLSFEFFQDQFTQFKENLGDIPLTSEHFSSSGQGADALAAALLEG